MNFNTTYLRDYFVIGMGVLGTTITPWGQFFISSFAYDKKIEKGKVSLSQMETYWGAFLTDFFSFFMIVATAATLFVHSIELTSGEQAALAIQPFAGDLAGELVCRGHSQCRIHGTGGSLALPLPMPSPSSLVFRAAWMTRSRRVKRFTHSTSCSLPSQCW